MPGWLQRVATQACARGGVDPAGVAEELDRTVDGATEIALAHLAELLATDVDRQRTTPLSVFREATAPVAAFLRERGVHPPPTTPMSPAARKKFGTPMSISREQAPAALLVCRVPSTR